MQVAPPGGQSDANCSEIHICASGNVFINYRKLSSFAKVAAISSFLNLGLCPVSAPLPTWTPETVKTCQNSKHSLLKTLQNNVMVH